MNITTKTILTAMAMLGVVFAGCIDDDPTGQSTDDTETKGDGPIDLGNKGAINGLVVDDNFRPIQLKEDWGSKSPGEFQDLGFVLIIETGQRFETNENGEFQVLPLEPGTYTIRVAADNHEAKDTTINVVSGEYTEITLEARRTFSDGGTTLSQEQVLFMSCTATTTVIKVAVAAIGGCGDLSGDSGRFDFFTDYSSISEDIRGMVTEMRAEQDMYYSITIRTFEPDDCGGTNGCEFGDWFQHNEKYGKLVLYPDKAMRREGSQKENTEEYHYIEEGEDDSWRQPGHEDNEGSGFWAMTFDYNFQTALFPDHPSKEHQDQVLDPIGCALPQDGPDDGLGYVILCDAWGNGVTLGVKAQFLQNVFLYELPEEGIEDYCALCADADIPE